MAALKTKPIVTQTTIHGLLVFLKDNITLATIFVIYTLGASWRFTCDPTFILIYFRLAWHF
ncbi:MAG: hypothetical protein AB2693_17440, partial [Candidatus Thiodiazotropha sp.]